MSVGGRGPLTRYGVSAVGEAMLRLSVRAGDCLEDAAGFEVHVAGSEANVTYALAKVGVSAGWASVLPRNNLGRRVAQTLAAGGVDIHDVYWTDEGRLGLFFVEFAAAPRTIEVIYDRGHSAVTFARPDWFDWDSLCDAEIFHLSGITPALSASAAHLSAVAIKEAKLRGCKVSFDVNYRQKLWAKDRAADAVRELSPHIDILFSTAEDARDLFGAVGDRGDVVTDLQRALGVETVVVTFGASGAAALQGGNFYSSGGHAVDVVDRFGAGDAFAAGLLWGLLDQSVELGLRRGLAMSALKMTRRGDLFSFARSDVMTLLATADREVTR